MTHRPPSPWHRLDARELVLARMATAASGQLKAASCFGDPALVRTWQRVVAELHVLARPAKPKP
jgi:hypothetical protein